MCQNRHITVSLVNVHGMVSTLYHIWFKKEYSVYNISIVKVVFWLVSHPVMILFLILGD
jgi:hypothetical protein